MNLDTFGDDFVETLLQHFGPMLENAGVESVKVEMEWTILKENLYRGYASTTVNVLHLLPLNKK